MNSLFYQPYPEILLNVTWPQYVLNSRTNANIIATYTMHPDFELKILAGSGWSALQPHHLPVGRAANDSGKQCRQTAEPVSVYRPVQLWTAGTDRPDQLISKSTSTTSIPTWTACRRNWRMKPVKSSGNAHISFGANRYSRLLIERYNRTWGIRGSIQTEKPDCTTIHSRSFYSSGSDWINRRNSTYVSIY